MTHKYEIRLRADGYWLHKTNDNGEFSVSGPQWGPFPTLDVAESAWKKEKSKNVWKYDDEGEVE